MTKTDGKLEELLAKHPSLTKPEAMKIVAEKNERKKKKRAAKTSKADAQKIRNEANRPKNK